MKKKTIGMIMIFVLIGICFLSNASSNTIKEETPINIPKPESSNGHGLGGIRGGIVFSPEDTQGYGYTHEEVLNNIQKMFGEDK